MPKSAIASAPKVLALLVTVILCGSYNARSSAFQSTIDLQIVDDESREPVSARLEFTKSGKRVKKSKRDRIVGEQWLVEKQTQLSTMTGDFEFLVERGPEFKVIRGGFTLDRVAKDSVLVEVPRAVDMHAEHWYSGDHASPMDAESLARWQAAEALDVVVTTNPTPTVAKEKANKPAKPPRSEKSTKRIDKDNDATEKEEHTVAPESLHGLRLLSRALAIQRSEHGIILHGWNTPAGTYPNGSQSDSTDDNRPDTDDDSKTDAPTDAGSNARGNNSPNNTSEGKSDSSDEPSDGQKSTNAKSSPEKTFELIAAAKGQTGIVAELTQPWARDVPILLAHENVRTMQLLSSLNRPKADEKMAMPASKADKTTFAAITLGLGKDRVVSQVFAPIEEADRIRFKDARGIGRMTEFIYWQMLETGLRISPTAASGFGLPDTHLGYNRVYAYSESQPDVAGWWHMIQQGSTVVTNGPLLRTHINGSAPGGLQASYRGQSIPLDIAVDLSVREPVDYLDVIFNGTTLYSAKLEDHYNRGEFPPLEVTESGWLVVRVVTAHEKGYRLATTAPFYFEFDGKPRISKKAVEFFLTWLLNAKKDIQQDDQIALKYADELDRAQSFWQERLEQSNAP